MLQTPTEKLKKWRPGNGRGTEQLVHSLTQTESNTPAIQWFAGQATYGGDQVIKVGVAPFCAKMNASAARDALGLLAGRAQETKRHTKAQI